MKDQPIEFDSVNIELETVSIHYSDSEDGENGWRELETNSGMYNLLDLQDGVTAAITDGGLLPVGKLQQMRLILGDNNYVVVEGESFPLDLSSQDKTGLKINLNTTINAEDSVEITIDFDAEKSIIVTGSENYKLKPVIKLEEVITY
jgi:hypothetical protein